MNERIKELITRCLYTTTDYSMGIDSSVEEFDKEKFAELIINECANLANKAENDEYWIEPAGDLIKKHFGVN